MDFFSDEPLLLIRMIVPSTLICIAVLWILWKIRPAPYDCRSLKEREVVYTSTNIACRTIYPIWCHDNSCGQEFAVFRIVGHYMYIGVYQPDWRCKDRSDRFAFKGWTAMVVSHYLLEREDLNQSIPTDNRSLFTKVKETLALQLN